MQENMSYEKRTKLNLSWSRQADQRKQQIDIYKRQNLIIENQLKEIDTDRIEKENLRDIINAQLSKEQTHIDRNLIQLHRHDATNDEKTNLPIFKSIELLTQIHYTKLLTTIMRSNPTVIADFIQQKLYLMFLREYFLNPAPLKEKQKIVDKGRTSNRVCLLLTSCSPSLFEHVFCYTLNE
jgi:hypothetical protein